MSLLNRPLKDRTVHSLSDADQTREKNNQAAEAQFIKSIITFGESQVSEIMRTRLDIFAIEQNCPFDQLMLEIVQAGYSRVPVYNENLDNVIGILHIKLLLAHLKEDSNFDWNKLLRPALFVPETMKLDRLLSVFKARKTHVALVVDEYGGTSGIVTLEDVLEEIVGDISDEFDIESEERLYQVLSNNVWLFEAKISINDFCKVVDVNPEIFDTIRGESESLAGLLLEQSGSIPSQMEEIDIIPFRFRIESADDRRIRQIRVSRIQNSDES